MRITDILKRGIHRLRVAGVPLPVLDAEVLLAHCLAVPRSYLYAHPYEEITTLQERCYDVLLVRRERHEPVAYLIGEKEFWSRAFTVDRRVLIPRPETEVLVEEALMRVQEFGWFPPSGSWMWEQGRELLGLPWPPNFPWHLSWRRIFLLMPFRLPHTMPALGPSGAGLLSLHPRAHGSYWYLSPHFI